MQYINNNEVKAQDVVTIKNLAENSKEIKVDVNISGISSTDEEILMNNVGGSQITKYKVEIDYYEETDNNPYIIGAIKKIKITKK